MDPLELLSRRLDMMDTKIEAERENTKRDRHALGNSLTKSLGEIEDDFGSRIVALEKHSNGSSARAQIPWMKWVITVQGAAIAFLLGLLIYKGLKL